jgi:hypothetical protein
MDVQPDTRTGTVPQPQILIDLACGNLFDTAHNDMEFLVSLKPSNEKSHIANSWRRMETKARSDMPRRPFWKTRRALRFAAEHD